MTIATGVVALVVFAALAASILFLPTLKLGRVQIGTYWLVALLGAIVLLAMRAASMSSVWQALIADSQINPLKILVLFFAMTFLSVVLDEVGLFRYLAAKAVAVAGNSQTVLFVILYALTAALTVFTSNDIVILTLTPFICFFCKNTDIRPLPYLVAEFAAANTWSMMLLIGNPTNIYLATAAGIDFVGYVRVMALPTVAAGLVQLGLLLLLFYRMLHKPLRPTADPFCIQSKPDLILGVVHLTVCLVFLVIADYIGVPMWLVAACCAASLLLCVLVVRLVTHRNWQYITGAIRRMPWQLIPFVLSMFVVVVCLQQQGIARLLGDRLGADRCVWTYGAASFAAANLINNIPMSILFSTLPQGLETTAFRQAVFATIVGSNIGAFLTPIGALAGIMFTQLTQQYGVDYRFKSFVKYGAIVGIPTIGVALGMLSLLLFICQKA